MNIKLAGMALFTTLLLTGTAMAQQGNPGAHFIENWDDNGDGVVTLAEVEMKRSDVFYMFDEDDNGSLTAQEYVLFDETRAADMANQAGQNAGAQGGNNGNGGNGGGKGGGHNGGGGNGGGGQGGQHKGAEGMSLDFNDHNNDGEVSQEEFISSAKGWFEMMDRNSDGELSPSDFGRPS